LREAVGDKRAEHVGLDFFGGAEALADNMLRGVHDLAQADGVSLGRQESAQDRRSQQLHGPWQHGEGDDGGEVLLCGLDVLVHVRVGGEEAEWLAKGDVRDDVEGEVLRLAAEVERTELRVVVGREVFRVDEVDEGGDIGVDALLESLDFFAGVLNSVSDNADVGKTKKKEKN
jgi:hypothetical protein